MNKRIAVLQPGYLPWLGFFEQIARVDQFIVYDDVQYDKNGWRNRNRVKNLHGEYHWLTVPVTVKDFPLIKDVKINNTINWPRKHLGTLKQFYKQAPHFNEYFGEIEKTLTKKRNFILDLNMELIAKGLKWLNIETPITLSSELSLRGDRNQRLLEICERFGATHYYSGLAAKIYLDENQFRTKNIEVVWQNYQHPEYPQINGPFLAHLSFIDLLLNIGPEAHSFYSFKSRE